MSVKRNALIMGGGIILLISYARSVTPADPIPPTTPDLVKVYAGIDGDPLAGPTTARFHYWPRVMVREQGEGYEKVYVCPSGTAEKDLMNSLAATSRTNFTGDPTTSPTYAYVNVIPTTSAPANSIPESMFLLIRTGIPTVQPFTCPSGTAERDLMTSLPPTTRPSSFVDRMFHHVRTFPDGCADGSCEVDLTNGTGGLKR